MQTSGEGTGRGGPRRPMAVGWAARRRAMAPPRQYAGPGRAGGLRRATPKRLGPRSHSSHLPPPPPPPCLALPFPVAGGAAARRQGPFSASRLVILFASGAAAAGRRGGGKRSGDPRPSRAETMTIGCHAVACSHAQAHRGKAKASRQRARERRRDRPARHGTTVVDAGYCPVTRHDVRCGAASRHPLPTPAFAKPHEFSQVHIQEPGAPVEVRDGIPKTLPQRQFFGKG